MIRLVTHTGIVKLHKDIAMANKSINGFYRFNWNEINNKFRSGVATPALLLESHSSDLEENPNRTTTFANRRVSFLLLDFTGKADAYDKQEEVLDDLENIGLDIISYLKKENNDSGSWLYGKFQANSVEFEKVGPIFDNMYGWNIIYTLKNHEPMCYDPDKWEWNSP